MTPHAMKIWYALLVASIIIAIVCAACYHVAAVRVARLEGFAAGLDEARKAVRGREARE